MEMLEALERVYRELAKLEFVGLPMENMKSAIEKARG